MNMGLEPQRIAPILIECQGLLQNREQKTGNTQDYRCQEFEVLR
jgi:hypothetical protein